VVIHTRWLAVLYLYLWQSEGWDSVHKQTYQENILHSSQDTNGHQSTYRYELEDFCNMNKLSESQEILNTINDEEFNSIKALILVSFET